MKPDKVITFEVLTPDGPRLVRKFAGVITGAELRLAREYLDRKIELRRQELAEREHRLTERLRAGMDDDVDPTPA